MTSMLAGVSNLLASLGRTERRVVLGHMLNTSQHVIIKNLNVVRKFTILCWATFTAILGCTRPVGRGLDTPVSTTSSDFPPELQEGYPTPSGTSTRQAQLWAPCSSFCRIALLPLVFSVAGSGTPRYLVARSDTWKLLLTPPSHSHLTPISPMSCSSISYPSSGSVHISPFWQVSGAGHHQPSPRL